MSTDTLASLPLMDELSRQQFPASTLYVVATPIGNIGDISLRALKVLSVVDAVACEDTRNSAHLLSRLGINKPLIAAHEHNEREAGDKLIARLLAGERIALVSDAGTPAVSDPGARIVEAVRGAGLRIVPVPGACAAPAALSASGLVHERFYFAGFLATKAAQRDAMLDRLRTIDATLVLYEAPHRIRETLSAIASRLEPQRRIVVARELTKLFEEIHCCTVADAVGWLDADAHREKGEFVLLIEAQPAAVDDDAVEADRVLKILLNELPVKQAAALVAQITGMKKNALYQRALQLKDETD